MCASIFGMPRSDLGRAHRGFDRLIGFDLWLHFFGWEGPELISALIEAAEHCPVMMQFLHGLILCLARVQPWIPTGLCAELWFCWFEFLECVWSSR
jgi:hypothetical protein